MFIRANQNLIKNTEIVHQYTNILTDYETRKLTLKDDIKCDCIRCKLDLSMDIESKNYCKH